MKIQNDSCEFETVEKDNIKAKKVYYLGDCETLELWDKDEYEVLEIVDGMFKIKDDLGREYLNSPNEKIRITRLTCRGKICIMNAVS